MKNSAEEETGSGICEADRIRETDRWQGYTATSMPRVTQAGHMSGEGGSKAAGYAMWKEYCYPAILYEYLEYIIEDAVRDYNVLSME